MKKLLLFLCTFLFSVGMWAEVETIATFSNSSNTGWTIAGSPSYSNSGGYQLVASSMTITTPNIDFSDYNNITINITCRKYGGPNATQGKISVKQGSTSGTELATYSPSGTSLTASGNLSISPSDGSLVIYCPGASSSKGCGISAITIKGEKIGGGEPDPEPETPTYASLAELVAAGVPTEAGSPVNVTLTNEEIQSIYMSGAYRNGVNLLSGSQTVLIYCRNVPAEWVAGGNVSGTLSECDWKLYNGTWELCPDDWSELNYTAPAKTTPTLSFARPTYTTTIAEGFTAPTLNNPGEVTVTYTSSETGVATVNETTGAIQLEGEGTTVITASYAGDETHNPNSASYTLVVEGPSYLIYETGFESAEGFTATSTYNQTYTQGPAGKQWKTLGTTSTNDKHGNSQGMQMRVYSGQSSAPYAQTEFDLSKVSKVDFWYRSEDINVNKAVIVKYSLNGGTSWNTAETVNATNTSWTEASVSIPEQSETMRIRFEIDYAAGSNTKKISIDDVKIYSSEEPAAETNYDINVAQDIEHGTVSANASQATEGTLISLTVTPEDGYELESLSVKDGEDADVEVTNNQFSMPASDVTISATFRLIPPHVDLMFSSQDNGITITKAGAADPGSEIELSKGIVKVTSTNGRAIANNALQIYKTKSMVVKAAEGYVINKIAFTYATDCYPFSEVIPTGIANATTKTATGKTAATFEPATPNNQFTFTNVAGGQTKVNSMVVYYEEATGGTLNFVATSGDDNYYATFSCDKDVIFDAGQDIQLYTVAVEEGKLVTLEVYNNSLSCVTDKTKDEGWVSGYYVQANTGVLVYSIGNTPAKYYFTENNLNNIVEEVETDPEYNMLRPASTEMEESGYEFFKLAYGDWENKANLGFFWGANDGKAFEAKAGGAYLAVPTSALGSSGAAIRGFVFDKGNATAIKSVENSANKVVRYNLAGQRVNANMKGIIVVNGKKMLNK